MHRVRCRADDASIRPGSGVRLANRTRWIATSAGTELLITVQEEYRSDGSLVRVREASNTASWVEAGYTYDVHGRLWGVAISGAGGATTQNRSFTYDGPGFLTSETHPESGTTSYTYDARGHVHTKTTPAAVLTHTYDPAERLSTVEEGQKKLKQFFYNRSTGSVPGIGVAGKLVQSVRHNHLPILGEVTVTETYTYGGIGGVLSTKVTATSTGETFTDSYAYTDLGAVLSWSIRAVSIRHAAAAMPLRERSPIPMSMAIFPQSATTPARSSTGRVEC